MQFIDFRKDFAGFEPGELILLDTCVVLALSHVYDVWHPIIRRLFVEQVIGKDLVLQPYINPVVLNETAHLVGKPLELFMRKNPSVAFSQTQIQEIENQTINGMKKLIRDDVLKVINPGKPTLLLHLDLYKHLGSADAFHVSLANEFGLSFLTVDYKLVENIQARSSELDNLRNVYYTRR